MDGLPRLRVEPRHPREAVEAPQKRLQFSVDGDNISEPGLQKTSCKAAGRLLIEPFVRLQSLLHEMQDKKFDTIESSAELDEAETKSDDSEETEDHSKPETDADGQSEPTDNKSTGSSKPFSI